MPLLGCCLIVRPALHAWQEAVWSVWWATVQGWLRHGVALVFVALWLVARVRSPPAARVTWPAWTCASCLPTILAPAAFPHYAPYRRCDCTTAVLQARLSQVLAWPVLVPRAQPRVRFHHPGPGLRTMVEPTTATIPPPRPRPADYGGIYYGYYCYWYLLLSIVEYKWKLSQLGACGMVAA